MESNAAAPTNPVVETPDFSSVRTFILFVGYPRSGHSLIGSIMDAHPNIIIAHEVQQAATPALAAPQEPQPCALLTLTRWSVCSAVRCGGQAGELHERRRPGAPLRRPVPGLQGHGLPRGWPPAQQLQVQTHPLISRQ